MNYKHKQTGRVAKPYLNPLTYTVDGTEVIPSWIIEDSRDWEEVKEVLFVTDDGVDVISKHAILYCVNIYTWANGNVEYGNTAIGRGLFTPSGDYGWKHFSTTEARQEFIILNKPVLSLIEMMNALNKYGLNVDVRPMLVVAIKKEITNKLDKK